MFSYPRNRFLRGGLGHGMGSSFSPHGLFSRRRDADLLGYGSRRLGYGYGSGCQNCTELPGEHVCGCEVQDYQLQMEYRALEESVGMGIGCGCPVCPNDIYGYGLYGGGGISS